MREITPENAADYLRQTGHVPKDAAVTVRALGGGVSNVVLRVDVEGLPWLVLKQARERLRTEAHWVSRLDRIWTERAALELLATILPPWTVPPILFSDEENYLIGMFFVPGEPVVWKEALLAGKVSSSVARRAGEILGTMHAETIDHPGLAGRLSDTTVFDELRIDPFYRTIALAHRDLKPRIDALIASMASWSDRTFVHADFSPKNILIHPRDLAIVDFETAHAGDPAFDLGFVVSHLLLKGFRPGLASDPHPRAIPKGRFFLESRPGPATTRHSYLALAVALWDAYAERVGDARMAHRAGRAIDHLAACALARVDGKSPVDYLDEPGKEAVRRFASAILQSETMDRDAALRLAAREMHMLP